MTRRTPLPPLGFQKQSADLSGLRGKKPLDVRVLEKLKATCASWLDTPEGRRIMNWIRPRAERAARKGTRKMGKIIDSRNHLKLAKRLTPQQLKKPLFEDCEALCKAIVFMRDLGDPFARFGQCTTHKGADVVLQWGHFIAQNDSDYLRYEPDNSGPQCGSCNGPYGQGQYAAFYAAIEARKPGRAVELEAIHAATEKGFGWTVRALEEERDRLIGIALGMGIDTNFVLKSIRRAK